MGSDDGNNDTKDVPEYLEHLGDGNIFTGRSCTDCCMIIVFTIFCMIWAVILVLAIQNGKPSRIIMPENFRGELCGDDGILLDYPNLYVPKPSRYNYGLCVKTCPTVGDYICNNDVEAKIADPTTDVPNHFYNMKSSEFFSSMKMALKCVISCNDTEKEIAQKFTGLQVKLREYKCFMAFYTTGPTLFRCLPFQSEKDNATLAEAAGESLETVSALSDKLGVGAFFSRGFGEMEASWVVILICCFTACIVAAIWIFLLRWILAPLVYLCIILIFLLLIALGYFCKLMADDLENITLPGDTATQDQVRLWRALEYAAFLLAAIYFVVMLWMLKRIRIAICIMKEASKAFLNNPGLVIIPPIVLILLIIWIAIFLVTCVYIQTIGTIDQSSWETAAASTFGNSTMLGVYSAYDDLLNVTNNTNASSFNASQWETDNVIKALHAYNFFGFLWVANFCIMFGFFIMAMTVTCWYFSATNLEIQNANEGVPSDPEDPDAPRGRYKGTPVGTMCRSLWAAIRYHLGTILWGALLIAIVQFVRAVILYLEEEFLNDWKENATVRCVICCVNCCLECIERVVKIISKNAFIISCIKNSSFCSSARDAMRLLLNNCVRVAALSFLSTVAIFILKLFIVGTNMVIAYFLIQMESLTQNKKIESGLFPMVTILIISFIIATLFMDVYESCVDTILMCFFVDEEDLNGKYFPVELGLLLDKMGDAEKARRKYEKRLKRATDTNKKVGEDSSDDESSKKTAKEED